MKLASSNGRANAEAREQGDNQAVIMAAADKDSSAESGQNFFSKRWEAEFGRCVRGMR